MAKKRLNYKNAKMFGFDGLAKKFKMADFTKADLRRAYLHKADLEGALFISANLEMSNLSGANLWNSDFSFANLSCSNLSNAHFWKTKLKGAKLAGSNLKSASFSEVKFYVDNFNRETNFENAIFSEVNFTDVDISEDFSPTQFSGAKFLDSKGLTNLEKTMLYFTATVKP